MLPYREPPRSEPGRPRELVVPLPETSLSIGAVLRRFRARLVARAGPDERELVLRVESHQLTLFSGRRPAFTVGLHDLHDVELDARSIEKLVPRVRPDGVVGAGPTLSLDVARIVLVVATRDGGVALSDSYGSYGEAVEWMGRVRLFLRGHGWVPLDEREA